MADRASAPVERSTPGPGRHWTRREIAEWLVGLLTEDQPTLVGIDHGFSFPMQYFETHGLPLDWPGFLDDFQRHWPTDGDNIRVDDVRNGLVGNGAARSGNAHWRRLTEVRTRSAMSVFHFDVPGQVAKSTHSGLPWLRRIRAAVDHVHFWPFDGWDIPAGASAAVEVYPSLWSSNFPQGNRTDDQHDAYVAAAWMRRADSDGSLSSFLNPELEPAERERAEIEGWILGVA